MPAQRCVNQMNLRCAQFDVNYRGARQAGPVPIYGKRQFVTADGLKFVLCDTIPAT